MQEPPLNSTENQALDEQVSRLMGRIANGEADALLELYDTTGARFFEMMSRASGDKSAAEGAILDTYTQLWRHARALAKSPSFLRLAGYADRTIEPQDPGGAGAEPDAYLRDMLAVRIQREKQLPGEDSSTPHSEAELFHSLRSMAPSLGQPRRRPVLPWIVASLFALLAAAAAYQWRQTERFLDHSIQRQKEVETGARTDHDAMRAELEATRVNIQRLSQINAILASPGARVVGLAPQSPGADLAQAVFLDLPHNRCIITGRIAPAPEGKSYQVWLATATAKVSAGLLKPDATGVNFESLTIDPALQKIDSILLTVEPEGGSEQPTTRAIAIGRVPSQP